MINHGQNLLGKQSDEKTESANSDCVTKIFDVEHYEKTGKLVYFEGEQVECISDTAKNTAQMKSELTTIEQFEAIGNTSDVAKKYNVSVDAANGHKSSLRAKKSRAEVQQRKETEENEMSKKQMVNKPTCDELITDRKIMSKVQAMEKYDCGKSTLDRWVMDFGLPYWRRSSTPDAQNGESDALDYTPAVDWPKEDNSEACGGNSEEKAEQNPKCCEALELPFVEEPEIHHCFGIIETQRRDVCSECAADLTCCYVRRKSAKSLKDLAEPEPAWETSNFEVAKEILKDEEPIKINGIPASMYTSFELEEFELENIRKSVSELHKMKIERVNQEMKSLLIQMVEGLYYG